MEWNFKIKYCDGVEKSEYNELVITGNIFSGKCVKLTQECWEIIDDCINSDMTVEDYLLGYDEDSKNYIKNLLGLMLDKCIIRDERNQELAKCKVKEVYLLLTNKCNLRCIHCSVSAGDCCESKELTTEEWKKIIDKHSGMKLDRIILSGGEPLVRKDLFEIARYIKSKIDTELDLMTNGTLITEDNVDEIVSLFDSYSISLDGVDEESCAIIRGAGTFGKAMKGIELLKSRGVKRISLSFVKVKQNEDKVDEFKKFAESLDAFPMVRQFEVKGRAEEHLELIPTSHKTYYDPMLSCPMPENGHFYPEKMPDCIGCGAVHSKYTIDECGRIFPCQILVDPKMELGNALEIESIEDYVNSGKICETNGYKEFVKIHPARSEECKECPVKLFCASCIYQTYNMMDREDKCELCKKKKEGLMAVWN